jgi:hypothetical protein
MKPQIPLLLSLTLVCAALSGCVQYAPEKPVEEGVIYAVQYEIGNGQTEGFTRLNVPSAVPGGNGRWNINAYGKLYHDFLMIRFRDSPDLSYQAIPIHRLFFVQFGDGGIKQVDAEPRAR